MYVAKVVNTDEDSWTANGADDEADTIGQKLDTINGTAVSFTQHATPPQYNQAGTMH